MNTMFLFIPTNLCLGLDILAIYGYNIQDSVSKQYFRRWWTRSLRNLALVPVSEAVMLCLFWVV